MKKFYLLALFLLSIVSVNSQDIIYTISATKEDGNTTYLDSILFENLDNETKFLVGDLPDLTSYDINLSTQSLVTLVDHIDFLKERAFKLIKNIPGEASIQLFGEFVENTTLNLFNVSGQKVFTQTIPILNQHDIITVKIPFTGVYILSLSSSFGAFNYRVLGSTVNLNGYFRTSVSTAHNILPVFDNASVRTSLKSSPYDAGFSFQPEDSIRVTAFLGGHYTYPHGTRITDSKSINFTMLVSTSEITLTLSVSPTGAGEVTGTGNYHEGEEVEINANAHDGYEFVNWTGDTEYISNVDAAITTVTMPGSNISLTANFDDDSGNGNGLTGEPCPGMPTFTDERDGNVYNTVLIGDQCWLKENLKYLPEVYPSGWGASHHARYYVYGYQGTDISEAVNTDNYNNYGVLYNWPAAMNGAGSSSANPSGVQGACPAGWHLPSHGEWTDLVDYVVSQGYPNERNNPNGAGNALKSCRQVDSPLGGECATSEHPRWNSNSTHYGTDQFGFSALPGGQRLRSSGNFFIIGSYGYWWSSTEYSSTDAWYRFMINFDGAVNRVSLGNKQTGFSVRCVRD